ncbi:MAG TPA: Ig-like domain-containing protein [Gemmatimonadales bacterium]|jgi:hypothetical protein|nr:Ig-like domain-containing protein [Gemmatimonadales bacterium]
MRVLLASSLLVSAATLFAGCESPTGPGGPPDDPGPNVLTVAPGFATIEGTRSIKLTALLPGSPAGTGGLSEVVWASSDTNVAVVHRGGLVEGRKAGRVQIAATWKTAHGSATVVVLSQVARKPGPTGCLKRIPDRGRALIPDGSKC